MDCSYLTKQKYFGIFIPEVEHTFLFVWPYQNKRLNCWCLFYSLTRQTDRQTNGQIDRRTDRQTSSVLYNLMQMEVFFRLKKRISLVSTAIAMNRLTLFSHLTWFP